MKEPASIAIDAMGGDNAPGEIVKGAIDALKGNDIKILLAGKEHAIREELEKYSYDAGRVAIIDASEVITNDEAPATAIRQKKNSSVALGLLAVKEGRASSFVSAGPTGAILTGATVIIGRIKGIERPALGALLPNAKGFSFLIDSGANVDSKPSYLLQFAKMGSIYMENVVGIQNPRVGLLNIGAEKEKGNALVKEAYELIERSGVNFIGNIEARDVPMGGADVVVADGFAGNVVLKHTEGLAKALMMMIKKELMSSFASKIGAALASGAFKNLRKSFDYTEIGGAPFLGLKGLVVKAHGESNARAIEMAVRSCISFSEKELARRIEESLSIEAPPK
ncbi:MAG: phosphate acyltransferase PlsX [Clostridiales bacterium]|jgi:glycerol-3-phosphate acyltransferase PlsX|nr:phosphate acyltransferase PlsX [Clostridiales bacterium]